MLSNHLKDYAEKKYGERLPYLKAAGCIPEEKLWSCTPDEAVLMKFFYGTMPLRDAGEYEFGTFLSFVKHALWLRENKDWCAALPEDIFVNHVLYYRINSEDISENRSFFYEQIKNLLPETGCGGDRLRETVLAINYWCAENAAYQASDMRTASPMTVYRSGKGRCGEESTFAVTAFRSAGIPARQVYTPRWAHCDDNHAWVEVWLNGKWYFLGACEPEEILNKGWFSHASSRALLVHSRNFSDFTGEMAEECIGKEGVTYFYNNTSTYARTKKLTVTVRDREGKPAKGAEVSFEILNMAEYCSVATLRTDEKGEVSLTMGLGDIHIRAMLDGWFGEVLVSAADQDRAEILLDTDIAGMDWLTDIWTPEEVKAPEDYPVNPGTVTSEQKQKKREKLAAANRLREDRIQAFYNEEKAEKYPEEKELLQLAAGNFEELYRFLEKDANPDRKALLHSLSQKDYKDAKAEVLEDTLIYAGQVRGTWEEETYRKYLLCPRIYYEELTPYRAFIRGYFTDEQKEGFIKDPESIWRYIEQNIGYEPEFDYETICASPVGCLKLRQGNPLSRKILFAAICRTLGIPARLNRVTQEAEYLGSDGFRVPGKQQEAESEKAAGRKAGLTLQAEDGGKWIYFQTWTIGKLEGMRFATLDYEGLRFDGKECRLELETGIYRLITTARMPNGNQHASQRIFAVKEGEEKEIFVSLREGSIEDMLVRNEIPEFEVTNSAGERQKTGDILKGADGVICFLEEGAEPTEHVLNELMERAGDWNAMTDSGVRLVFIVRDKEALSNKTVSRTLEKIPAVTVVYDPEGESAEPVARRMYVDPEKLPLLAVTRAGMTGIYASSGYNVGSVDLMLKILSLQENR